MTKVLPQLKSEAINDAVSRGASAREKDAWQREMERAQMSTWFQPALPQNGAATAIHNENVSPPLATSSVTYLRMGSSVEARAQDARLVGKSASVNEGSSLDDSDAVRTRLSFSSYGPGDQRQAPAIAPAVVSEADHCGSSVSAAELEISALVQELNQRFQQADQLSYTTRPVSANVFLSPRVSFAAASGHEVTQMRGLGKSPNSLPAVDDATPVRIHTENTGAGLAVWLGLDGDAPAQALRIAAVLAQLHQTLAEKGQRLSRLTCNGRVVYESGDIERAGLSAATPNFHDKQEA